jgi:exopolyphosphatase/guanosine-5'-triphosphate,3'-diphosphate pyrophosphatase
LFAFDRTKSTLESVAAVDLGSNSFHLIVAQLKNQELSVIDRLRESVRLGAGLDEHKQLTPDAQERALACLERFGQRVGRLPVGSVRVVGTNALRQARNSDEFLIMAEAALGHPVEIIGGREEARLIYLGVAHGLAAGDERRLVIDIGGGSTEIITGTGFETSHRESLHVGCVSLTRTWFADGRIKRKRMRQAELQAELEIQPVAAMFRKESWDRAIGCSGTVRAIRDAVQNQGWCKRGITRSALDKLREMLVECIHVDDLRHLGLSEDRLAIFPGGVAVLWAVFDMLDISRIDVSSQALREGVLYDLVGRIGHTDVRSRAVKAVGTRWAVDNDHAERVAKTALALLAQVQETWELEDVDYRHILYWGALLHEIGLLISHSQYHRHGAYVVANTDLSGFSRREQAVLAALVRGHRRKFPLQEFHALHKSVAKPSMQLCVLLRLAVLLHRSRELSEVPTIEMRIDGHELHLRFPKQWLDQHPLTAADLGREQNYLEPVALQLNCQ